MTGIDNPYEVPESPDVEIDTQNHGPGRGAQRIVLKLESLGLVQ